MKNFKAGLFLLPAVFIAACDGGGSNGENTNINVNPALVADAGLDQVVEEGDPFTVSGSVSGEDGSVEVQWSQVDGPMVEFEDTNFLSVNIRAPRVRDDSDVVLRLTVTGATITDTDDVVISISDVGNGPTGPSAQGINDNGRNDRRDGDRDQRNMVGSREVRTYDGSNNNIDNPEWGASFSHLQRLGEADYEDGVSTLAGTDRPSARVVSNLIANQDEGLSLPNDFNRTDMVWQWGQFIDHDLDLTDGAEESADIAVPEGDPQFDPTGTGTAVISFSRALFDSATGTSVDNPREQENEITSWIDGSMIYGSDAERALALRVASDSPFLASSEGNLLPFNLDGLPNANGFVTTPESLFLAGDVRANEQLGLTVMHTLWMREHNRLVQVLIDENFSEDPEEIFQQARRLVIAKLQKITYDEFLPALIGQNSLEPYRGYDDDINPTIYNEFSAAAFRFGHSLLNQQLLRLDASNSELNEGHLSLRAAFFTGPSLLTEENSIDPILRGLASQPHQAVDPRVIQDVRNFLFGAPGDGGLDLASLNVQRGRDHGVPSYNDMREVMGLDRYTQFAQITSDVEIETALASAYDNDIDKIDLWVGGLAEDAEGGSQFGPLLQAVIVQQFSELRDGDRFWYERDLSNDELQSVQQVTLAQVIRDNTAITTEIQDDVFTLP